MKGAEVVYQGHRFLGVIPARGGSKGVPRKNIREMAGKPLISWSICEAKKSQYLDCCIVSTDDKEICHIAKECGAEVPFLRPVELAQDDTASIDVVLHVMERLSEYDYMVLLQPTSPFRTVEDIDNTITCCMKHRSESCVSVTETEYSPYWMYTLDESCKMNPLLKISQDESYQRQKLPKVYRLNGAVYVNSYDMLKREHGFIGKNTIGYIMPQERSYDIDTLQDFEIVEILMKEKRN